MLCPEAAAVVSEGVCARAMYSECDVVEAKLETALGKVGTMRRMWRVVTAGGAKREFRQLQGGGPMTFDCQPC